MKPLTRQSFLSALKDSYPETNKIRKEYKKRIKSYGNETYVIGMREVDTIESRRLNNELGLNTIEGIDQWYFS